jgi:pyroglutamyl-peptidase
MENALTKKVLITGFMPFGKNKVNPSEEAVNIIVKKKDYLGIILPVDYIKALEILTKAYSDYRPDIIISLGLAAERHKISVEINAYNQISSTLKDESNYIPANKEIVKDGAWKLTTKLNIAALKLAFDHGFIPSDVSHDAGRFLCNYIYYQSLILTHNSAVFIHLPLETKEISVEKMAKAVGIAVAILAK